MLGRQDDRSEDTVKDQIYGPGCDLFWRRFRVHLRKRSLQSLISALTQAGRSGLLFRLPAVLYGACPALREVPALGCSTKARNEKLRLLSVPSPSERSRQPGAWWAHSPQVWRAPSLPQTQFQFPLAPVRCVRLLPSASPAPVPTRAGRVPAHCVSLRPSPPPCLLPRAGLSRSAACELFSGFSPSLCSKNGRQCVRPVNLLSLFWSPTVHVGNSQKLPRIVLRALRPRPYPKQCRLRLPSWDGPPSLALLSHFLSFIFCPTSFRRQWAAFLGAW
ncbi:uncharacterized protein ACBT57_022607 [Dama dama]